MPAPKPRRLTAQLRKEAIARSALPLFARKGLDGVTTQELAASCGVSEALIFRHFPTKEALFRDLLDGYASAIEPPGFRADSEVPSTRTLVQLVYLFIYRVVVKESAQGQPIMRLFYRSLVDDGEFAARFLRSARLRQIRVHFAASLAAAQKAGDAVKADVTPGNLFWFVQHLASMGCLMRLPSKRPVRYSGQLDAAIGEMVRFALRGIGVTEAALRCHATAEQFDAFRSHPLL